MVTTSLPIQPHIQSIIQRYTQRTAKSKAFAEANRAVLADKSSIGFNFSPETKEMCYPVVAARSQGSRLWDIDGNEYIDILMGLGTNLFGHNPGFIREAIEQQLQKGIQIGPQAELVGSTARLVSELTGLSRVTFSNTGTEAVMTAVRIARAATKRNKIAVFTNSYHGHFDAALMRAPLSEYARKKAVCATATKPWLAPLNWLLQQRMNVHAVPAALGIPKAIARDVIVLEYDNPQSLQIIKAYRKDLAAVLVEPIQSRCPEIQPRTFLSNLRDITQALDIALIFDEMVTGFRLEQGGAQAYFGIAADMATYSKIAGGGLPLSIVAGSDRFMNHIDGGQWRFGDDSKPKIETTFFAGTFCKHPLALAAAHATLTRIKAEGPALQAALTQKTRALVERLNSFTADNSLPVRFTQAGSFFVIALTQSQISPLAVQLLSYHLLNQGIHLRGGDKGGFLSTAHTAEDIDAIYSAFKASLSALKAAKYL
jgi:glutamate-1-semialdehyde 2,1-aminomutase